MDNQVTPPSLIGAGVAQQPTPPQDMLGMLRSQGSMPAEAMSMMQAPQANPGLAAGSGTLAALGGAPGANPYLAQQAQQAAQQQAQQTHMAAIAQKAQQARQAQEAKRQEALLRVSQELLHGDNEDGRKVGAKGLATYAKSVGLDIPQSVVEGMATKRLTAAEYNDVLKRVGMGMAPQEIAKLYPNLKPQDLADIQKVAKNPVALKAVGLQTPDEQKASALSARDKELTVWAKEKGIKLDGPVHDRMTQLAKRPLTEMTDTELQALKTRAEADVEQVEIKKKMRVFQEEESIRHRNRIAEIQEREDVRRANPAKNPALKPQALKLQAEYHTFPALESRALRVKQAVDLLSKEGLLTEGGTLPEWALVQMRSGSKFGRADINAAFNTLQRFGTPLILGAEKDIAGQPIGGVLRLKSVAESEVGGINRIPKVWWDDFFSDYEKGIASRKDLIRKQLDVMGSSIEENPLAPPAPLTPQGGIQAEYNALRKGGMSPEQAKEALSKRGHQIQ